MKLADTDVLDFIDMYRKEFGVCLSFAEGQDQAIKLVCLMDAVYQPMTIEEYAYLKQRDANEKNDENIS
jgi:hypothetical protein